MADANEAAALLLYGKVTHEWSCFGKGVIYDSVPAGTEEQIQKAVSGLDLESRKFVQEVYEVAYWLRSFGGYDFAQSLDDKLKFVRGMHRPLFRLFVNELRNAELKAIEAFSKARDELKT